MLPGGDLKCFEEEGANDQKHTSAMPSERIQLSNQRANTERRFGGGDGNRGGSAPYPVTGAPSHACDLS